MESYLHSILNYFDDFMSHHRKSIIFTIEKPLSANENSLLEPDIYLDKTIVDNIKTMKYGERRLTRLDFRNNESINLTWEFWDHKPINKKLLNFLFEYTCFIIYLLTRIKPQSRNIVVYLYNYDGMKNIPNDSILKGINVNSGLTYYSPQMSTVIVYRKEEIIKVLTHELIHACGIDDKSISSAKINKLNELFCVERDININESFTDAFACLLNLTIYTILENSNGQGLYSRFNKNFNKEFAFIKAQCYKVLLLNNYKLYENGIMCTDKNYEKTNGIAYYVLKAIIFNNFIKYILKHNYILKDVDEFLRLIYIGLRSINWITFGKKEYIKLADKRSLRMSSIDILELINLNKTI